MLLQMQLQQHWRAACVTPRLPGTAGMASQQDSSQQLRHLHHKLVRPLHQSDASAVTVRIVSAGGMNSLQRHMAEPGCICV
jgi:hypothetical protein